jgi:hypothetical protein
VLAMSRRTRSTRGLLPESVVRRRMQVALSLLVAVAALYLVLFQETDGEAQKWAFGVIGIILGFWLKH